MEFRNVHWFNETVYTELKQRNIALVMSLSPNYHFKDIVTADFTYMRLHGPAELFKSTYQNDELERIATYLKTLKVKKQYIYFNNTMSAEVLNNAQHMQQLLG